MIKIKYFSVGIIFSLLLTLAAEAAYGSEDSIEIIAYANSAVAIQPIVHKSVQVSEKTINKNNIDLLLSTKLPAIKKPQKITNPEIASVNAVNNSVSEMNNNVAMLKPARNNVLSRKQMNEAGVKMLRRFMILPMMYSNIRKK